MVKNCKSRNNTNVRKSPYINNQMQHQIRGKNTVKPLKQTDTVEVASSNLAVPTMRFQGDYR